MKYECVWYQSLTRWEEMKMWWQFIAGTHWIYREREINYARLRQCQNKVVKGRYEKHTSR